MRCSAGIPRPRYRVGLFPNTSALRHDHHRTQWRWNEFRHQRLSQPFSGLSHLFDSLSSPQPLQPPISHTSMAVEASFLEPVQLWKHPHPEQTQIHAFKEHISRKTGISLPSYNDLWTWSVDHPSLFWEEIWHWTGIKAARPYTSVRATTPSIVHRMIDCGPGS